MYFRIIGYPHARIPEEHRLNRTAPGYLTFLVELELAFYHLYHQTAKMPNPPSPAAMAPSTSMQGEHPRLAPELIK